MTEASGQASTSALKLPSRRNYITALSTVAFLTGITVATIVTVRRGRRMRIEELQNKARNLQHSESVPPANRSLPAQGPLTLFKEMNRAAFGKKSPTSQGQEGLPSVLLHQRGKQVKASVFDSNINSVAPSALMKATSRVSKKEEEPLINVQKSLNDDEMPSKEEESLMESPVLLAVKAIGIATALVGTGALITWEIAKRALGVQNVDELIDRLAVIVPSRSKDRDALQAARKLSESNLSDEEWEEEMLRQTSLANNTSLMSTDEALEALDVAAKNGEVATWVSVLSRQLDAEREQDIQQRRQRIARLRQDAL